MNSPSDIQPSRTQPGTSRPPEDGRYDDAPARKLVEQIWNLSSEERARMVRTWEAAQANADLHRWEDATRTARQAMKDAWRGSSLSDIQWLLTRDAHSHAHGPAQPLYFAALLATVVQDRIPNDTYRTLMVPWWAGLNSDQR